MGAKEEREAREAIALERARSLGAGDYFASGRFVATHTPERGIVNVLECESHWDACLVLLATPSDGARIERNG